MWYSGLETRANWSSCPSLVKASYSGIIPSKLYILVVMVDSLFFNLAIKIREQHLCEIQAPHLEFKLVEVSDQGLQHRLLIIIHTVYCSLHFLGILL
jgi:hypothetical protein